MRVQKNGLGFHCKGCGVGLEERAFRLMELAERFDNFSVRPKNRLAPQVCAFTRELETLHPGNRHIRTKIRQQLQVLRDACLLLHLDRGRWRIPQTS